MRLNPFALMFPLLCAACLPASPKGPAPVEGVPVQVFALCYKLHSIAPLFTLSTVPGLRLLIYVYPKAVRTCSAEWAGAMLLSAVFRSCH